MNRTIKCACFAVALTVLPSVARSQYNPRPAYGYPPGYVNPYYPGGAYGNALSGAADLTQAQGNVPIQTEKAYLEREKVKQEKLVTKRKAFDQMMYEQANTPSYVETLTKEKGLVLTRMMNFPQRAEIVEGKTLNTMLPLLQSLVNQGSQGPPVPIPQSKINDLNLSSVDTGGSVGMLRAAGSLEWPVALNGPRQVKLDKLIPAAVEATIAGKLTAKSLKEIRTEMKAMREEIRTQFQKEEIEPSSYMRAVDFYESLYSSITALERPDARKQLSGAYAPRARNVQELVDFMTDNGLKFTAASPGNEGSYQVVHDAFVRYARTAQSSSGLASMQSPVSAPAYKKK